MPWYPALAKPAAGAPVIHLGVDPFFSRYPMRSYPCDVPIAATPAAALPLLAEAVRRHAGRGATERRAARVAAEHAARRAAWDRTALDQSAKPTIGFAWAARCIGDLMDESTVVVNEYPLDRRFAAFTRPGTYFASPHSSGLGFGLRRRPRREARPARGHRDRHRGRRRVLLRRAALVPVRPARARSSRAHGDLQQPAMGGGEVGRPRRASGRRGEDARPLPAQRPHALAALRGDRPHGRWPRRARGDPGRAAGARSSAGWPRCGTGGPRC